MTKISKKQERVLTRLLEILPGFVSWNLILFPYWGVFVIPNTVAYFVLFFNIYWFYQSFQIAISASISHIRIQASMIYNWMGDVDDFADNQKVRQVVIIPTYMEPPHTLTRTLDSLVRQTYPLKQMVVVIAQEYKADADHRALIKKELMAKYKKKFGELVFTVHKLKEGEIIGKASNERYAALKIKKLLIDKGKIDMDYTIVTSCDADHVYHEKHFAALAYKFLDSPSRYRQFWQPAVMFYNNIWDLPAITRVPNTLMSIWNLSQLPRRDRLINAQNYSLSFKLLDEAGYWDPDKIPEDWGIFFKALFNVKGGVEVEPLYLPLHADAVQSTSLAKTMKNQYEQLKRWAWGASDTSWIVRNYFTVKEVPFWDKTMRVITFMWAHFLWPVNWFIITIGLTLPTIINPAFGRTTLGYTVPKISSFILTLALGFLIVMLILDHIYKPKRPDTFPIWRTFFMPFEFILMPITGFLFGALPGIDAHTRLMLGKYIEYKATEKV